MPKQKPLRRPDFTERELRAMLYTLTVVLATDHYRIEDGAALESARLKIAQYRQAGMP